VRIPRIALGTITRKVVWIRVAPRPSAASRSSEGTARSASSVVTITTGKVSTASVRDAQRIAGCPHTGSAPSPSSNESRPRPTKRMKKPSPKRPKTIDGTPARFATAARTQAASREPFGAYSAR